MKLKATLTDKPWGQTGVPHLAGHADSDRRIGEVAFEHPGGLDLAVLIKYLYTSERLSIQVHPNDDQARAAGHPCGKDEMWIVLQAEPGATIGLGLKRTAEASEVSKGIADGSIVELIDWRAVQAGDVIYNKAGTIHAAGAGLVLLEVQQAVDLTYRLFDYGRPRDLHLEQGLAVSRFEPHFDERDCQIAPGESRVLACGPYFGAAWCSGRLPAGLPIRPDHWQVVTVSGEVRLAGQALAAGEAALLTSLSSLDLAADAVVLLAWPVQQALEQAA
jgi:mannose-6-phosphate isomerase